MSQVVYKYELLPSRTRLMIPAGAQVRHVGMQGPRVILWVQVDPSRRAVERVFESFATGEDIFDPGHLNYIGTTQDTMHGTPLVFHHYERVRG